MRILHLSRVINDRRRPFPIFTLLLLIVAGFVLGGWLALMVVTP